jgi:GTP-binding protein EngB required for normal cell division
MAQMRTPARIPGQPDDAEGSAPSLEASLQQAISVLSEERALEASRLLDRWRSRTFVALVVGEFKRGKSTLLNALIGEGLLPMGVPPVTAVPTRLRYGPRRRALARLRDGSEYEIPLEDVRDYVDESRNPGNQRDLAGVDIELPTGPPPGAELVDVPGLGSIYQHNTDCALATMPEADAALVVVSVDPPIGEAELRLLRITREHAARVEVVLNKVDYLDEAGRKAAEDFTRRALAREGFPATPVWPVSARDGLRARLSHDALGWRRSGMEALSASLTRFLMEERADLLARSLARKAGRLVEQESALLELQVAAAARSSQQLQEIAAAFRSARATAERNSAEALLIFRRRFDSLFAGYSKRAALAWADHRSALDLRLREGLAAGAHRSRRAAWRDMEAAVRATVDSFLGAFIPEESRRLARAYAQLRTEVGQAAAERAEAVWRLAADLLPFEPPAVEPPPAVPAPRPSASQLESLRLLLDGLEDAAAWLLPSGAVFRRLAVQACEEAEARYGRAVEQSRETFTRAYEDHFRSLLAGFEAAETQTGQAVEAALATAEERARTLEAGRVGVAPLDMARRSALHQVRDALRRIEEGTVASQAPNR